MLGERSIIDYALARRAVLLEVRAGRRSRGDVCDASVHLLRAARFHGRVSATPCPLCETPEPLTHVTWVYGEELGESSGEARPQAALPALAAAYATLRVYLVEVCRACHWNHLLTASTIGMAQTARRRARRATGS